MVQLLKEQMDRCSMNTTLPQSSQITVDTCDRGTSPEPTSVDDRSDTDRELSTSPEPVTISSIDPVVAVAQSTPAVPFTRSAGSRMPRMRPPLLHSVSLPSPYRRGTGLSEVSSSLATVLMDRMLSLETLVAEQQRKSEVDMARLLNQVDF